MIRGSKCRPAPASAMSSRVRARRVCNRVSLNRRRSRSTSTRGSRSRPAMISCRQTSRLRQASSASQQPSPTCTSPLAIASGKPNGAFSQKRITPTAPLAVTANTCSTAVREARRTLTRGWPAPRSASARTQRAADCLTARLRGRALRGGGSKCDRMGQTMPTRLPGAPRDQQYSPPGLAASQKRRHAPQCGAGSPAASESPPPGEPLPREPNRDQARKIWKAPRLSALKPAPTLDQGEGRAPSARLGQLALGFAP